jgi:hypothetical protein
MKTKDLLAFSSCRLHLLWGSENLNLHGLLKMPWKYLKALG